MSFRHVVDAADGLQILTVAANILNNQSRTADNVWSSSLGVGLGAINFQRKSQHPGKHLKSRVFNKTFGRPKEEKRET
jgi:hypothetical protein